jgi:hypothetical protein
MPFAPLLQPYLLVKSISFSTLTSDPFSNHVLKYNTRIQGTRTRPRRLRYPVLYYIPVWYCDEVRWAHRTYIITFPPTSTLSENLSTGLSIAELFYLIGLATRLRNSVSQPTH